MNDHGPYTDDEVRALPLAAAKTALLADILEHEPASSPTRLADRSPRTPRTPRAPRSGSRRAYRLALAGIAAAAVVAVGTAVVTGPGSPGGSGAATDGPGAGQLTLAAMAARMPRFVLDAPGWEITTVYGFGEASGTLAYTRGSGAARATLELTWHPAAQHAGYLDDREADPSIAHEPTRLVGQDATLFTYDATDHATMLPPAGRSFVEIRGMGMSEDGYRALTGRLREASVEEFVAALPDGVTTPEGQGARAEQVLADIPVPDGFRFVPDGDTLDAYQLGALVTGQVACAWIEEYADGDARARQEAAEALATSHRWAVLRTMDAEGDWPEFLWELADRVAADDLPAPEEWTGGLGCES